MKSIVLVMLGVLVAAPARAGAEDSLQSAKDLYASAAYEEALAMLTRLGDRTEAPEAGVGVDQYRAFCMFALGRTSEAESIAEAIIRRKPLIQLDPTDASPRIQAMFTSVRQRLLPSLIRERVRTATARFEAKDLAAAESPLLDARQMLAEAEGLGVNDEAFVNLRVLVDGFLQLTRAATPEAPAAPLMATGTGSASPASHGDAPLTSIPAAAAGPRVYSVADEGVSPPTTIDQRMPPISPTMAKITRSAGKTGLVDVIIDETGEVADVIVRRSVHSALDRAVADAARQWKYEPAMKDGVPVQFVKTIAFVGR
jgi:TonB family protein